MVYEPEENRAAAYDGEKNIGESTYSKAQGFWIIDHTFVDDDYRGQALAGKLVAEVVDQARKNQVKIIPLCPFAKKEFEEKEAYADVWQKL
ncbi:MAG: GNAT family N-acetyltransferase [Tissierellia bacterium]|nr:GNAT family N-acetyltransferase [Tissierellia bacterium]